MDLTQLNAQQQAVFVEQSCTQCGVSPGWLLKKIGIDRKVFYYWRSGDHVPKAESLMKLRKAVRYCDYLNRYMWEMF